jgi:hypothetical protein
MKKQAALALLLFTGCAHPYTLDPLGGKPEELNGILLSSLTMKNCVLQVGYEYSTPKEMLVKVRVMNKEKAAFEVDYSAFTMNGSKETVKPLSIAASDPDKYLKDLKAEAEVLDSRTHMETYQGVEELGALNGKTSDTQIDAAKDAYKHKVNEAEAARQQAVGVRKRIAVIEPGALRKTNVKSGESAEGALIFKADFGDTGVVTISSAIPACTGNIQFMLKK